MKLFIYTILIIVFFISNYLITLKDQTLVIIGWILLIGSTLLLLLMFGEDFTDFD